MANTGKIERAAVRAVEEYLDKCPMLEPYIDSNDKTPIWDGDIFLYDSEESKSVNNFVARVPLQVKGTTSTKDCYYIETEYIKGFKSDRGCVFFMVQVLENPPKVLYAILSSQVLDCMLKRTSNSIRIDLQEVPFDPLVFEKELYTFAANRNNEKVENTSPKEIAKLVEGFDGLREHLVKIENKDASYELESLLDSIKNLKDDGSVGWRDKFYFFSRKAIDLAINNIKGHDFVNLHFKLGKYLQDQKQYYLAEDYYLKVLKECRKRSEAFPNPCFKSDVATTLNNLAAPHFKLTRYEEAEKEYKEALEIYRELAKSNHDEHIADVAMTLNNLGNLHKKLSRYAEAEEEYKESLKIRRELATTNREVYIADVAQTLNGLGCLYDDLTRYDEAEEKYYEALEIRRELVKTNRDAYIGDVAQILNNLGNLHKDLTRYEEAEEEYKEALKIRCELAKTNRDAYIEYVAMALNNLAALHVDLTHYDEAEKEYKRSLEIFRELTKTNHDAYIGYVAGTLYNIALLQEATDRKTEAWTTAEEALCIFKKQAMAYPQIWNSRVEKAEQLLSLLQKLEDLSIIHDITI